MGYYTQYNMEVHSKNLTDYNDLYEYMKNMPETPLGYAFSDELYVHNNVCYFYCRDMVKWYEHEDDIATISKQFPEYLFVLNGEGEDSDDIWKEYFYNGEYSFCGSKIVYDHPSDNIPVDEFESYKE